MKIIKSQNYEQAKIAAATQYSLSKSEQWAKSTMDPGIIDFVGKVNRSIQSEGTARWEKDLMMILNSMNGDKNALVQLKQRCGSMAIPIQQNQQR